MQTAILWTPFIGSRKRRPAFKIWDAEAHLFCNLQVVCRCSSNCIINQAANTPVPLISCPSPRCRRDSAKCRRGIAAAARRHIRPPLGVAATVLVSPRHFSATQRRAMSISSTAGVYTPRAG
eukprot:gene9974-biopygen3758